MAKPEKKTPSKSGKEYMKYSGWGFQLFVSLYITFWLGKKMDMYLGFEKPWIAIFLVFAILIIQFYVLIKELS